MADMRLGHFNVITGLQSSGKSCILKTACFCAWVEKRIELAQSPNGFASESAFIDLLADYYNMRNYIRDDTYIAYKSSYLEFSYDHAHHKFSLKWQPKKWLYRRTKISYVPADRNLAAVIPQWGSVKLDGYMIDFMASWGQARKEVGKVENFLDLGMTYAFNPETLNDSIILKNGLCLTLKESSSGVQSLIPLLVHIDYLSGNQYTEKDVKLSYDQHEERKKQISTIYEYICRKETQQQSEFSVTINGYDYYFSNKDSAEEFRKLLAQYLKVDHSEIFLEEPEDNLFPPTQCKLVDWLIDHANKHGDMLFVTTHSPYVLNQFIKRAPKGLEVFFTYPRNNEEMAFEVKQLSEEEIHEAYDNGVDLFFNFEVFL